jgi:uncharacterized membrane protein
MLAEQPVFYAMALLAALGSALVGGVFLAFSDFVMKALGRIAPEAGVPAMQEINVVVLRSWFLRVFFATAMLSVALVVLAIVRWTWPDSYLLLAGGLLYLAGPFAVTVFKNVPLNNKLARDGRAAWAEYLVAWTRWNHLRTVAALAAAALFALAL